MRQRKLKDLEEKLGVYSGGIQIDPTSQKSRWHEFFEKDQPIYMELGCGKGQFILSLAQAFPQRNFIAVEGNASVMLRALQKAARLFCQFPDENMRTKEGNEKPFEKIIRRGVFAVKTQKKCELTINDEMSGLTVSEESESGTTSEKNGSIYAVAPNLIFVNMYVREVTDCFAENELSGIYLNFSDPWPKERHAKRRLTHTRYLKGYGKVMKPGSALEFKTDNEALFRFSTEEFQRNGLIKEEYSEDLHASGYESKNYMTEYEEKFSSLGNPIYYCKVRY